MSTDFFTPAVDDEDPAMRAQKLAAARRKLKTFRAGRTSSSEKDHISCPSSASSRSRSSASVTSLPLTSDTAGNTNNQALFIAPPRSPVKGLETPPRSPQKLRKPRSKGNLRTHGRKGSSIGGSHQFGQDFFFGTHSNAAPQPSLPLRGVPGDLPAMTTPSEIITTPATPLMEHPASMDEQVKTRLSTFSFGSKPPPDRLPSPRRSGQPLLPSQILPFDPSPSTSPSKRLSTPHSRPPSLLLTKPTPLTVGTPSSSGPSRQMESPKTPPTPARTKRHSHTRSSSISLPNLKLASRPGSLGVSTSPSFPSPSSPVITRLSTPQGTKLKFEPSGRGAEAEREKDEYRRKALEKLTGTADYANEIALPELDDDVSSTTSSARPFSGVGSFTFGSGQRNSWTVPDDNEEAGLGFGLSLTPDEYSLPSFPSTGFNATHDTLSDAISAVKSPMAPELGHGLPSIVSMPNRPSMTRNLSVLAEVDEPEEGETESDIRDETLASMTGGSERSTSSVLPTPSRLRELHLVTTSGTPPVASPTTYSGARGRPRPLSGTFKVTPKSSTRVNRRSSISYKKDDSVSSNGSSRDWSLSSISKGLFSPGSPTFASPRMASRPCPRPKVLAGLSLADGGSRRVLDEVEEEGLQTGYSAFGFPTSPMMDDPRSSEEMSSRDSMFGFRGSNFELEMERDGLREEVDKWKDSYHDMEERWIAEKREVVLLRERLRKLGDRLSSFSSESTNLASDRMMADMRNELFGVTSQLDKERAEKLAAQDRILELEEQLARAQCQSVNQAPVSPPKPTSSYLSSPLGSLPNNGASPDPNLSRIKGWGFPRGPIMSSMSREPRNRDSFFGLSNDLRRGSGEPQPGTGVDLPPFSLTPESASHSPFGSAQDDTTTTRKETSTSLTGSAMSYFSAYLPQAQQSTTEPTPTHSQSHASSILDFTRACRCCTGEVIQL